MRIASTELDRRDKHAEVLSPPRLFSLGRLQHQEDAFVTIYKTHRLNPFGKGLFVPRVFEGELRGRPVGDSMNDHTHDMRATLWTTLECYVIKL